MLNTILLNSNSFGENVGSFIALGIIIYFWYQHSKKKQAAIDQAYAEYQEALKGTDKRLALAKGRYYVSLLPKKSQLLKETEIQNDLHGMDDAVKS